MNWYYALNNEQLGPVDRTTLDRLAQEGTLTPQTLVWHEGMADWKLLAEATLPANAPALGGIVCAECGRVFPTDEVVKLGDGHVCAACKPVALQKLQEGVLGNGSAERIRQEHIQHEASIKSVGMLYLLGSVLTLAGGVMAVIGLVATSGTPSTQAGNAPPPVWVVMVPMFLLMAMSVLAFVTALGLRKLKPWSRIASGILSGFGLLGFPVGTLINAYILWLLFSKKGATVFSEDYQRVVAATPHVKYRMSIVVWIVLGLFVALILFGAVAALFVGTKQ